MFRGVCHAVSEGHTETLTGHVRPRQRRWTDDYLVSRCCTLLQQPRSSSQRGSREEPNGIQPKKTMVGWT